MAIADAWAIQRNIWVLNPEWSLWPWARGVHPEEVLFFLLSSTMCVWGLTLAVWASRGYAPLLGWGRLQGWLPIRDAVMDQGEGRGKQKQL